MLIKVATATTNQLNYLVAKCEGVRVVCVQEGITYVEKYPKLGGAAYTPITDGELASVIIERERIHLEPKTSCWGAYYNRFSGSVYANGKTFLIAAMICFITTNLGAEVEIPDFLVDY